MRYLKALLVAALALVALATPAAAQFQYQPGGGIVVSTSEVSASGQVMTAQTLIPSSITTTPTGLCYAQHCQLDVAGVLGTAPSSAGTMTITFSYGGISTTVVSARPLETNLANAPWGLTCKIAPDSTVAAGTSGNITGKAIDCVFWYVPSNTAGTTPITFASNTTGTITNTATQTIVATVTFSATSQGTFATSRRQWFGAGS